MASNKQHIITLLVLFSFIVGFSQITSDVFGPAASGGVESFPCLKNLAPCQPYLKGSYVAPAICCEQLKVTITNDLKCLCDILAHNDLLKTFNITPVELMKLPKECGIDIKQSACKVAPPPGSSTNGSFSHNSTPSSSLKSAAYGITLVYLVWQFSLWL
uniref:Bifunctional inhibitor/plant lipid transfer protein/seed storage helical domain-containing protein n=1 Tax=Quercus lobata TaxID=97700 RepID=A0A7N2MQR3_QUELO